ncbi:hypothetical protein RHOSPDRAFT_33888 [Rhodotorula sp. JG-1b]|nr:hypothetical protein RHOSPDRAFT_33888 [Rhodotorula sp. JG-1b]
MQRTVPGPYRAVLFPLVCVIYAITGFKTDVQQLAQMLGAAVVPGNSQANMSHSPLSSTSPAVMFPFVCVIHTTSGCVTDVQQLAQTLRAAVVLSNSQPNFGTLAGSPSSYSLP